MRRAGESARAGSGNRLALRAGHCGLVFYLKHLQHVGYQRLERLFADVFGLAISQGALCNLLQRGGARFEAAKADLLARLRQAQAVASDETGVRVEGAGAQHWVFRSPDVVVHEVAFSRGAGVVRDVMGGHRPAYWTSDRYSAQQGHGQAHQTCLAHLARDAAWVLETGSERIGLALKLWFNDVFALARADLAASTLKRKRHDLERRIDAIVHQTSDCDETRKVLRKIANARDQLLTFLDAPDGLVDPTNNACERSLRPAVINRKVTNGFRSLWGARTDAALRSTVDTSRLNGCNPFDIINQTLAPR